MSLEFAAILVTGLVIVCIVVGVVWVRLPKKLKTQEYTEKWKALQKLCRDKQSWPEALEHADRLLNKALKKRKFKGNSMGERMVSAQRSFSDNDGAWFAHNLYKKTKADPDFKLKEHDVKKALIAFRQALRDLGALPENQKNQQIKVEK